MKHEWIANPPRAQRCAHCDVRREDPDTASSRIWGICVYLDHGREEGGVFWTPEEIERAYPCEERRALLAAMAAEAAP